jgi:hypothetical protein
MRKSLWFLTAIGSLLGALLLIFALSESNSAVKQSALAAMAIGLAAIPYCLARAASELQILKEEDLEDSWESTSEEDDS